MALVHIILVNWNGHHDTLECLQSLLRLENNSFRVSVCDNGSTDGSVPALIAGLAAPSPPALGSDKVWASLPLAQSHTPSVTVAPANTVPPNEPLIRIVEIGENRGFAGGNNVGITIALADPECRFVWLLNNDTVATPGALGALIASMDARPELAICGSTLLSYHQPHLVQGLGGRYHLGLARGAHIGHLGDANLLPTNESVEHDMAYVMGASLFARRGVFERTGGLSEDYFLYYEELDLAQHLLSDERQGWSPASLVFHKEGGSIGTSSISRPSDTSLYYLQVNTLRFYSKFYPLLLPIAFFRIARDAFGAWRRRDSSAVQLAWLASRDFLAGRMRTGTIRLDADCALR